MVTSLSSIWISFVRKSAPIVALYSFENFFCTYWFIRDVLPTLQQQQQQPDSKHICCYAIDVEVSATVAVQHSCRTLLVLQAEPWARCKDAQSIMPLTMVRAAQPLHGLHLLICAVKDWF